MTGGWGTPSWQGGSVNLGEVFVGDKSQQMAADLLEAVEHLGLEPLTVRTVNGGFIVPEEVWDRTQINRADREDRGF